ncbi:MAG: CocE/NonD family hydrolase [Armatimonadetes bacterium]|nr:CocE/NonD family hydrolase [Armatimonadota bacterium]
MKKNFFLAFAVLSAAAPAQEPFDVRAAYTKREVQIPMRDGVKLFTSIYVPKDKGQKYPFMMMRTPYSVGPYGTAFGRLGPSPEFAREGFIFVNQDVRGRYMSEGEFQWMTPYIPNKKPGQVDESTDTWDTIEWLLKNVENNNGRAGITGVSFPGHYATQALIDPHPALKAASPQAPMADNWLGDDVHHNGAFFLPHAMNFVAGFGRARIGPTQRYEGDVFSHGTPDGYQFFLNMGPLKNAAKNYGMDKIRLWNEWMAHGDYDEYWQKQNVPQHLKKVGDVPVMLVGGWFDAEDLYGPLAIYRAIEKASPLVNRTILVMGPWYHGSWEGGAGDSLHDIRWTTKTAEDFRTKFQLPFFKEFLKGTGEFNRPEVTAFDIGADKWREFDEWPPRAASDAKLYLGESLAATPSNGRLFDEYVSDPAKPVPNSATITTGMARSYMIEDQRFVWNRPDVLSYETPALPNDVTVAGPITATLHISTTGTDADFVVKLIDVYPSVTSARSPRDESVTMGGYQMLIRGEPMRAKYRNSWSKPEPLAPKRITKVEFVLPDVMHTFRKGHRIMVQVHSSWYPLTDRNPQTFVNIYEADDKDFRKATHRVYLSGKNASHISFKALP